MYSMRMARVNVYLPDALAARARAAGLNVSGLAQGAIEDTLAAAESERWLDRLEQAPRRQIDHASVMKALDEARAELAE